jgi:two-component system, chemotaxis family, protein-glutamate methylesterase/glutaminase
MSAVTSVTRVLVCEDSATYAHALIQFLERNGEFVVVGVCASGEEALENTSRLAPDLVTMDLELPGMGGLRATQELMRSHPVPVVVLSAHVGRGSEQAAAALAAGAVDALPKGHLRLTEPDGPAAVALRHRLRRLAQACVDHRATTRAATTAIPGLEHPARAAAIGICASTGGPGALATVLGTLPATFPVPVLVVQHMAIGFLDGFVHWLDERALLPVAVARHGMSLTPGIWFAPDHAHLVLDPSMRLTLDRETVAGVHRPSGDVLFASLAAAAGPGAIGVVLTGMGRDGGRGVAAIARAGGCVIAQDEATSVVFGMPRAAIEQGAKVVLPLAQIGGALRRLQGVRAVA